MDGILPEESYTLCIEGTYQFLQAQEAEIINVCVLVEAFDQVATQLSLIEGLIQTRCHILDVGGKIVHDLQK